MNINENVIEYVASLIADMASELESNPYGVPAGISAHHVHLTKEAVSVLFGQGYRLTFLKKLSQPGQFAAQEQVQVVGPSGKTVKMRVLGPERSVCQVEISSSDSRVLGVAPIVRASGDLKGTPGIRLVGPAGALFLDEGVIIAERHVHMTPADARWFGVSNGQQVSIAVGGPKAGIMEQVAVRVDESYSLEFHIDTDDANAFLMKQGQFVGLLR